MMLIYLTFILIGQSTVQCLTCEDVRNMPQEKQLTFDELRSMMPKDIGDCLQHVAREPLEILNAHFIWRKLTEFYEGISNIPESILAKLNWVTIAVTPEDYENITIASIDTVRNFGSPYNLDPSQLAAIAERVQQDFAGKTPEDYTCYDLEALNQILCAFNRTEIEKIHPAAYRDSALVIGKLRNCYPDVMKGFGTLAIHVDAFGPVDKWTRTIFKTVGNVAHYLPGGIPKELKKKLYADDGVTEDCEHVEDILKENKTHVNQ